MIIPIIFIFLGFNLSPLYDTTDYKYLLQYEPGVISYQDLDFFGIGRGYFRKSLLPRTETYFSLRYFKKYYSRKADYFLSIRPSPSIYIREDNTSLGFNLSVNGDWNYYPLKDYFFTLLGGDFTGVWYNRESVRYYSVSGEIRAGIGVGRIIPIMPIYKALKIEQELMNLGMLTGSLSKDKLEEIADQVRERGEYDDPRHFWRDLESVIVNSEQFKENNLGAVPTIRIDKILSSYPYMHRYYLENKYVDIFEIVPKRFEAVYPYRRGRGFKGELYFGNLYNKHYVTSCYDRESNKNFVGARFNYSHPLSINLQFSFNSIAEVFITDSIYWRKAAIEVDLTYELFNQMFTYWKYNYNGLGKWLGRTSLGFIYYIDYKMALELRGEVLYSEKNNDFKGEIFLGFNYLFF